MASMGAKGVFALIIGKVAEYFLGELADRGIIKIEISHDKLIEALKEPQWRDAALKAYRRASAQVYTDSEKDSIRKEYMAALSKYATFGNSAVVPDNQNP